MDWFWNHDLLWFNPRPFWLKVLSPSISSSNFGRGGGNPPPIYHCPCLDHRCWAGWELSPGRALNLPRHSVRATSCSAGTVLTNSFLVSKAGTADTLRRELDLVNPIPERSGRAGHSRTLSCIQEDEVVVVVAKVRHGIKMSRSNDLNRRENLRGSRFGKITCERTKAGKRWTKHCTQLGDSKSRHPVAQTSLPSLFRASCAQRGS